MEGLFRNNRLHKVFWVNHLIGVLATFLCINAAAAALLVDIPAGDSQALFGAIQAANDSQEETVIRLAEHSVYRVDLANLDAEAITGDVTLEGRGATLTGEGFTGFGQLFEVDQGGVLALQDLDIRGFDSGPSFPGHNNFGLIFNGGVLYGRRLNFRGIHVDLVGTINGGVFSNQGLYLELDGVRFQDIRTAGSRGIILFNGSTARLTNLLMADSVELTDKDVHPDRSYLHNAAPGHIDIGYSTFIARTDSIGEPSDLWLYQVSEGLGVHSTIDIAASIILDLQCPSGGTSAGFNLVNNPECTDFGTNRDLVGVSPMPLELGGDEWLNVLAGAGSPALDGVKRAEFDCPATDLAATLRPVDGDRNGKARCDIGAFEALGPTNMPLYAGGENGLYFDLSQDGHYVSIMEVRPNEYVITWNSFDLNGNQAWVLALGSLEGDTISAEGFFLPEGMLIPGGSADVDTSALEDWGTITIRLQNCLEGEFIYDSNLPQFGSGSFPLDRLAFVEGLGCRAPNL